jgi:glycosyl transferase family 25
MRGKNCFVYGEVPDHWISLGQQNAERSCGRLATSPNHFNCAESNGCGRFGVHIVYGARGIMKYFVINLDRCQDRLSKFFNTNEHNEKIERFRAVDGNKLAIESLETRGLIQKELRSYSRPALAVALSHGLLWEKCIEINEPISIFEDDAILNNNFFEKSQKVLETLPDSWEFIAWGWNFDSAMQFYLPGSFSPCITFYSQDELRKNIDSFKTQNFISNAYKLHTLFGAVAYSISPPGARQLKRHCFPIVEKKIFVPALNRDVLNYGFDVAWNEYHCQMESFVCFPPLAVSKNDDSTIQKVLPHE